MQNLIILSTEKQTLSQLRLECYIIRLVLKLKLKYNPNYAFIKVIEGRVVQRLSKLVGLSLHFVEDK